MILLLIGFTMRMLLFSDVIPACCADHTTFTEDLNSHDSNHLDSTEINIDMYSYMTDHDSVVFCGTSIFYTNCFSSTVYPS